MGKSTRVKYKKPPQAPRRFKSAYMFFSTEKHPEIREEFEKQGKTEKTTNIAKLVSQEWKKLTPEEREVWDEKARQDKARYEEEKKMYTGPWKVPAKRRAPKDPNAPKRPMSAFLAFSHEKRAIVREENPKMNNVDVSRVLAKMWKEAPEAERRAYISEELRLRQDYKVAIAAWRSKNEKKLSAQRKYREDAALQRIADGPYEPEPSNTGGSMGVALEMGSFGGPEDEAAASAEQPLPSQEAPPTDPAAAAFYPPSSYYGSAAAYQSDYYGYSYPSYGGGYADPWASRDAAAAVASYRPEEDYAAAYAAQSLYGRGYAAPARSYRDGEYAAALYGRPSYEAAVAAAAYDPTSVSAYAAAAAAGSDPYDAYYRRHANDVAEDWAAYQQQQQGGYPPSSYYR